jgi:hypothetical protein
MQGHGRVHLPPPAVRLNCPPSLCSFSLPTFTFMIFPNPYDRWA